MYKIYSFSNDSLNYSFDLLKASMIINAESDPDADPYSYPKHEPNIDHGTGSDGP